MPHKALASEEPQSEKTTQSKKWWQTAGVITLGALLTSALLYFGKKKPVQEPKNIDPKSIAKEFYEACDKNRVINNEALFFSIEGIKKYMNLLTGLRNKHPE